MNTPACDPLLALEALLSDADDDLLRTNLSRRHFRELRRERARIGLLRLKSLLNELTSVSQCVAKAWDSASDEQRRELEALTASALEARSEVLRIRRVLWMQLVLPLSTVPVRPLQHFRQLRERKRQLSLVMGT